MATLLATNAIPLTQISLGEASIGASYSLVGTFTSPIELMTIVSTMDAAVQVSFDGVNDHQAIPIGNTNPAIVQLNFKANRMVLPAVSVFVKRIGAPSVGSLFVSAFTAAIP